VQDKAVVGGDTILTNPDSWLLASRREVWIDFNLDNLPRELRQQETKTKSNRRTGKTYESIELQLEIVISHDRAEIMLVCGKVTDGKGHTTREGVLLGNTEPIIFS
jgi:hypothetical protein